MLVLVIATGFPMKICSPAPIAELGICVGSGLVFGDQNFHFPACLSSAALQ